MIFYTLLKIAIQVQSQLQILSEKTQNKNKKYKDFQVVILDYCYNSGSTAINLLIKTLQPKDLYIMGNQGSQFENQFYKRYSFIQLVQDKLFGTVKVYRKNTVKFDYIMILELQLEDLPQSQIQILEQRLKQIRSYQNQTTLRIYYFKFISPVKIQCKSKRLVIYAEYMNRSIFDYLCALRTNPKFIFQVNQIIYVLRNVAKSCITLKKMGITHPDLSTNKIFLSPEGQALLCPLLYILTSFKGKTSYNQVTSLQNRYQKYSISSLHESPKITHFALRQQFLNILLEMTGNIPLFRLQQTKFLYQIIQQSPNLQVFFSKLPQIQTQTMKIQQMHRMEDLSGEFYEIS